MPSGIARRRESAREDSTAAYSRRRDEIIKAAIKVFDRRGLQSTSVSAIAEQLDIDRATLYYYFASKEALFDEVVREVSEVNVRVAEDVRDGGGDALEKLTELVTSLLKSYATYYPILYVYIREDLGDVDPKRAAWAAHMRSLNRRYDKAVTAIIEGGIAAGTIKDLGPPAAIAFGVIGMANWTNRWFKPGSSVTSAEELGKMYAEILVEGLRA